MSNNITDVLLLESLREHLEINQPELVMELKDFLFTQFLKNSIYPNTLMNEKIKKILLSFYIK